MITADKDDPSISQSENLYATYDFKELYVLHRVEGYEKTKATPAYLLHDTED